MTAYLLFSLSVALVVGLIVWRGMRDILS